MKLDSLWIDGYGRFSGRKVDLAPGLQIVAGPNEQGKTTLREFIADVLYGQSSRSDAVDGPDRRMPWERAEGYGGRVHYTLDSGQMYELRRDFERHSASLRAITGNGERHPVPREGASVPSVEEHIRISKKVFLSVATISHHTLDSLGDDEALTTIRERLLALTDMGRASSSTEAALQWLKERMDAVGRPDARTRPLPRARAHRIEVLREHEECKTERAEIATLEAQRRLLRREIEAAAARHEILHAELRAHEKFERMERLRRAEEVSRRIDALTKNSFALAGAREFPLERFGEAEHAVALTTAAEERANTVQTELDALQQRLSRARKRIDPNGTLVLEDVDPGNENQLAQYESRIHRVNERIHELTRTKEDVEQRLRDAEEELAGLPDFSRHAADPVEWLSGLAGSFESAQRARDEAAAKLDRLRSAAEEKDEERADAHELFGEIEDFHTEARDYGIRTKEIEDTLRRLEESAEAANARAAELQSKVPGFAFIAALSVAGASALLIAAIALGNAGIFVPAAFAGAVLTYAGLGVVFCRTGVHRAQRELERINQKTAESKLADLNARELIESLMHQARCQTIWELEAAYERYREDSLELAMIEEQVREQEERADATAQKLGQLFKEIRETFLQLREDLAQESEVAAATKRAIGRYQAYRDAKRRAGECHDARSKVNRELLPLSQERDELKKSELKLSLEVRQMLRDFNYADEQKSDSALKALQGYRLRVAQLRQSRREVDELKGRVAEKTEQLETERKTFATNLTMLNELLEQAKVNTVDEYRSKAEAARQYHDEWKERSALEGQLDAILQGRETGQLRRAIETEEIAPKPSARLADELRADMEAAAKELDEKRQEDHRLHIAIAERNTGRRSLNEIEEERACVERQARLLELELQAASYAASVIEEVAEERHARLAPKLERVASEYLSEITSGTYTELHVGRDLNIRVRIPQTKDIDARPERRLSKGTIDQIYLALRLAMVRAVSENGERIPMLLDDPFANYDDLRLARAMTLLAEIARDNQILLFTCRDDVVRAAQEIRLPIIRL